MNLIFGTQYDLMSRIHKTPLDLIRENAALGSNAVCEWCKYLAFKDNRFSYLGQLFYQQISIPELAEEIKKKMGPVHIPVLLERTYEFTYDHIVVITLDHDKRSVEYYDSAGYDLDNQTRRVIGVNCPANQFIHDLTNELSGRETIQRDGEWEIISGKRWDITPNHIRHQYDFYNCGVHVCRYLEARQQGKTFQEIINSTVDPAEFRKHMIEQLKDFNESF